jgi:iron-sulfur cluster assembly protein
METELSPFPITLTPAAVGQVKRMMTKQAKTGAALRLGVKGGGCSGFEYVIRFEENAKPIDLRTEIDGLTVLCDAKSAVYLQGATFDYTGSLIGGGFKFTNPNVARNCGCGTSFFPKEIAS